MKGEPIGYSMTHSGYLLFGRALDRRAVRLAPVQVAWEDQLRRKGIKFFAVGPISDQTGRAAVQWLEEDAGAPFLKVYGHDAAHEIVLYRLLDGSDRR